MIRGPRFGVHVGRGWYSVGRSGGRVGARLGRTWVSTGRRGTRVGSGVGPFFANASLGARRGDPARPPARPRTIHEQKQAGIPVYKRRLSVGPVLFVIALMVIGVLSEQYHW